MRIFRTGLVLLLLAVSTTMWAQFESASMNNPDYAKELVLNEVTFWSQFKDESNGGFFNEVNGSGSYSPTSGKSFCSNSRLAYAFTRAFMITGDTSYLHLARHALNFVYDFSWDQQYGGWYYAADFDGSNPQHNTYNNGKWSFMQHYALLGPSAMNEATDGTYPWHDQNESDKTWLFRGLDEVNTRLWDDRAGLEGYYDIADHDWSNPHNKGFTPTADAMTTHATVMALRNIDSFYVDRFMTLADRVTDQVIPQTYSPSSPLIYEYADSDWVPFGQELFNGHAIKCAWQLGRAYLMDPSKEIYKTKAQQVLNEALARGYYDDTYGGFHYFQTSGQKNTWTQEQGVLAGILNGFMTDDPVLKDNYLNMADGCMKFVEDHLIDLSNGGSYTDVNGDGSLGGFPKGDYWEAGYHTTELAYYMYLYGNILLHNKPVELYYYFRPSHEVQVHKLTPMAIGDEQLVIDAVELNGVAYENFDAISRSLTIPAGEGGKFKVRFKYNPNLIICPVVSLGPDQSICNLDSITLNPGIETGNFVFSWYKDDTLLTGPDSVSNVFTIAEAGAYRLRVTAGEGCDRQDEVLIYNDLPTVDLGEDFVLNTSEATLDPGINDNGYLYSWFKDGVAAGSSETLTITEPGTYVLSISAAACGSKSDTVQVLGVPTIPYAVSALIIDGTKEAGYPASLSLGNQLLGTENSVDLSASWSSAWDNENLYVFVEVTDDDLNNDSGNNWWEDDGVELFIDGDNNKGGSYDYANDFQWGFIWGRSTVAIGGNSASEALTGLDFVIVDTDNGYNLEVSIPWTTIGVSPSDGHIIGIDVAVNDDDNGAGRDGKIAWNAAVDDSWQNTSLFGEMELSQDLNSVPVVDAGQDIEIQIPVNIAQLNAAVSGGDAPLTYLWSQVSGPSMAIFTDGSAISTEVSELIEGTYVFELTVTDIDGDIDSDMVTVVVEPAPVAVSGVNLNEYFVTIEEGETYQFTATVLPADAEDQSVTWSSMHTSMASIDANGLVTALSPGLVYIVVTTNDGGFTDTANVTVTELDIQPIADAGVDQSIRLPLDDVLLEGTVEGGNLPLSYSWSQVSGPSMAAIQSENALSTSVVGLLEGEYVFEFTVTDIDGDIDSDMVTVVVDPAPVAVSSVSLNELFVTIEEGETYQFSATVLPADAEDQSVTWSTVHPSIASIDANGLVTALSPGLVYIVVTTNDGGFTDTANVTVTELDIQPIADAGADQSIRLPLDSVLLQGTVEGGNLPLSYSWSQVSGPSMAAIQSENALSTSVVSLFEGEYVFELTVTDMDGDIDSDMVTVVVDPAPVAVSSVSLSEYFVTIEEGETYQFTATVLPADAEDQLVTWSTVHPSIASIDANGLVTALSPGLAYIVVTTNDGGFTDTANVTVTELDIQPIADAGADQSIRLPLDSVLLAGTTSGGNLPLSYSWSQVSGPSIAGIQSENALSTSVGGLLEGEYVFELTVTDIDGDIDSDMVSVVVEPAPVAVSSVSLNELFVTIEEGEMYQFSATVLPADAEDQSVTWSTVHPSIASIDANGLVTALSPGLAYIVVTTNDGGFTDTANVTVTESESVCLEYPVPDASNWVVRNAWNDGGSGSKVSNDGEALVVTHRAWGKEDLLLIQNGEPMELVARNTYTVSFDVKDNHGQLTGVDVGVGSGVTWNGPVSWLEPLEAVPGGISTSAYSAKEISFTSSVTSSQALLVIRFNLNRNSDNQEYLVKNLKVCEGGSASARYSQHDDIQTSSEIFNVYPMPVSGDEFTIDLSGMNNQDLDIRLIDINSRTVYSVQMGYQSHVSVPVDELNAGVYILKVNDQVRRVVIGE